MVPAFIKIAKILLGIGVVFCLFIFFMATAMGSVPYVTSRHYQMNESPSYDFTVVLEFFYPSVEEPQFECIGWDDFKKLQPQTENQNVYLSREEYNNCQGNTSVVEREYTTYLSVPEGSCANVSSVFKVQNVDAHTQRVRLRWAREAIRVRNNYRVDNNGVIPLYFCKFMSAGIAVNIFLLSVIAIPMTATFFRFCHKKYGKLVSAGWALVLIGLGTLNFAVFNHRQSLDLLTENPEFFIARYKTALIVSCILFVCAGVSFWIHKMKRIHTGN